MRSNTTQPAIRSWFLFLIGRVFVRKRVDVWHGVRVWMGRRQKSAAQGGVREFGRELVEAKPAMLQPA